MWKRAPLIRLIDEHIARHPAMEPSDVYKLLYQGVLGPEHLIASAEDFATRLRAEYRAVSPDRAESLWEAVRPDGALVRLNLRPFRGRRGTAYRRLSADGRAGLGNEGGIAGCVGHVRRTVPGGAMGHLPVAGGAGLFRLAGQA